MKLRAVLMAILLLAVGLASATAQSKQPKSLVSFNPIGPVFGIYQGGYEQAIGPHLSFYVNPTYFNLGLSVVGGLLPSGTSVWYLSAEPGVNYYFFTQAPKGLYAGGGLGLGYMDVTVSPVSVGGLLIMPEAHVGYRFIWGFFSLAPEVGVNYTEALFNLSSVGLGTVSAPGGFGYSLGLNLAIAF